MSSPVQSESVTVGAVLTEARQTLAQAGVEAADQEAGWLIEYALGCRSHQLVSEADRVLTPVERASVESVIDRRVRREPLQYILGTQEFCGLEFAVGPAVLIPRPETELLVSEAIRYLRAGAAPVVVDIGTGSGCLAVTMATIVKGARVLAIDCAPDALQMAQANAARHGVRDAIEWCQGDLLAPLAGRGLDGRVDVILSNPPYIAEADMPGLQPEVRDFEPRGALVSGPLGTEYHHRLLKEAWPYLAPGGLLLMEIGQGQAAAVRALAEAHGGYAPVMFVDDAAGIARVAVVHKQDVRG